MARVVALGSTLADRNGLVSKNPRNLGGGSDLRKTGGAQIEHKPEAADATVEADDRKCAFMFDTEEGPKQCGGWHTKTSAYCVGHEKSL